MALPAWFWQHLPFVVLALALPTQMLSNHFTIPDRNFATENVSRAFDQAINRAEDAVLTIAETLESYGLAGDFLEYIPHLHRPKLPPRDKRTENIGPIELDVQDLRRALHRHEFVLINFYAPWCVHCRAFEPTYRKIAERLHSDAQLDILVGKVDGTKHKRLLERHEIDAYPSVLLYSHGDLDNPIQYIDIRDPDMMVQWVNREVQKLAAGGAPERSYFGQSTRPKWRVKGVTYRVGDVIRDVTAPPGVDRRGVIIGWDYNAHGPPEWLKTVDKSLLDEPHYRVLWDMSEPAAEEGASYEPQTKLSLVLDTESATVQHPELAALFSYRQDTRTYEPQQKLRVLYPDD